MRTKSITAISLAFLLVVFVTTSAVKAQTTTFAQFLQIPAQQHFLFTNNGTNATLNTVVGGTPILFFYSNVSGLDSSLQGGQSAHLFIDSTVTTTPATLSGTTLTQPLSQTVVIRIVRDTPAPLGVGNGTRTNLLTATISTNSSTPSITGTDAGSSGTFSVTTPDHNVVFTSDFLSFNSTTERNLALSFSSIQPTFTRGAGNFLQTFTAAGTGTFATNPVPAPVVPTAASVAIGGRVLTPLGKGLSGAEISLTTSDGVTRYGRTSGFGYYSFDDVEVGQAVVISVNSKRYSYAPQVLMVTEEIDDLNFNSEM